MAKATLEKQKISVHSEGKGLIFIGAALLILLSLLSFQINDSSTNWLGLIGWGECCVLRFEGVKIPIPWHFSLGTWGRGQRIAVRRLAEVKTPRTNRSVFRCVAEQISGRVHKRKREG